MSNKKKFLKETNIINKKVKEIKTKKKIFPKY